MNRLPLLTAPHSPADQDSLLDTTDTKDVMILPRYEKHIYTYNYVIFRLSFPVAVIELATLLRCPC